MVEEVTLDIVSRKKRVQKIRGEEEEGRREGRREEEKEGGREGGKDRSLQGHAHNCLTSFHLSPPSKFSTTSQ